MGGSPGRRQRRKIARTGIARYELVVIDSAAVTKAVAEGINLVELVSYHVATALEALDTAGGDVLAHTVVTIGEHPDHPGHLAIEAKAANLKTRSDLEDGDDESAGGLIAGP